MKLTKRPISVVLLCALVLSCCCMLGGCMSKREKRIMEDLNNEGSIVAAVLEWVNRDYIDVEGFAVTEVDSTGDTEAADGTIYTCVATVSNAYVAVDVPCKVAYDAEDVFAGVAIGDTEGWNAKAVAGVDQTKVGYEELPNNESIPYGECTVQKVRFNKSEQTCTVDVDINADAGYVIASGVLRIEFAYEGGKWAVSGYSYGSNFGMSWDIGGLWRGDEWKWNKSSTMNLRIEFSIDGISSDGTVESTVHSHIRTGKNDKEELFPATGSLDFATMTLTLEYENSSGPCRITAKFIKDEDRDAKFEGTVIGTEDNFRYYKGKFKRDN